MLSQPCLQMVCADLNEGVFKENADIAKEVAALHPYGEWLQGSQRLSDLGTSSYAPEPTMGAADVLRLQVQSQQVSYRACLMSGVGLACSAASLAGPAHHQDRLL